MFGRPLKKPIDYSLYQQQYLKNLQLRAELDRKNYDANIIYKKTGQQIEEMPDNRTLTEKLLDLNKIKTELFSKLKNITDGDNANDIIAYLDDASTEYLYQNFPTIEKEIKKMFSKGVDAVSFIDYLNRYIDKIQKTRGVDFGLQESTGNKILSNQDDIIYIIQSAFPELQKLKEMISELEKKSGVNLKTLISEVNANINAVAYITTLLIQVHNRLQADKNEPLIYDFTKALNEIGDNLPTKSELQQLIAELQIYFDKKVGPQNVKENLIKLRDYLQMGADTEDNLSIIEELLNELKTNENVKNQDPSDPLISLPSQPSQPSSQPSSQTLPPNILSLPSSSVVQFENDPIARKIINERNGLYLSPGNKLEYLKEMTKILQNGNPNDENYNEKNKYVKYNSLFIIEKGGKDERVSANAWAAKQLNLQPDDSKFGKSFSKIFKEGVLTDEQIDELIPLIDDLLNINFLNIPIQASATTTAQSGIIQDDTTSTFGGVGLKYKFIRGRGIQQRIRSSQVLDSDMDKTIGIYESPKFSQFGRYIINKRQLGKGIIAIKRQKGSPIPELPSKKVSNKLTNVFNKIIGGNILSFSDIDDLDDEERHYLYKVSKMARIEDKLNIPSPNKNEDEKDVNQFEILKGQILAGNDNPEIVKKFKAIILKLIRKDLLPKQQGKDLLFDLTTLGH